MLSDHVVAMLGFAVAIGAIFAYSMRETSRERVRFTVVTAATLMALALVLGWLMFPFPR